MKTIKIIDLLNKIANGEEVPTDIKVGIHKFYKCRKHNVYDDFDYQNEDGEYLLDYLSEYEYITEYLSNEVEILDEEDEFEDIVEWGEPALEEVKTKTDYTIKDLQRYIYILMQTQNDLTKNQKKIIERINNERD